MIKCMILDFDGLVFDTETYELEAYKELYRKYQLAFPVEKWMEGIGSTLKFDPYESIMLNLPEVVFFLRNPSPVLSGF